MLIDIHTHVVPEHFPLPPRDACAGWPCMRHENGGAVMQVDGKDVRQFDPRSWDVDARLAAMASEGVDVHVLSPMPDLLSYWLAPDDAHTLARHVNHTIAKMVQRAPTRFVGLGALPLQDIDRAVDELPRIKHDLGLAGIEAGAFVNGEPLGSPRFFALFEALQRLDLALFVHPVRSAGGASACGLPQQLAVSLIDFAVDQGRCVTSFLANDIRAAAPDLRVAFTHGGGTFATILPRLQVAWERNAGAAAQAALVKPPIEAARAFFFDSLVYQPAVLHALVDQIGADRICIGTDEPYELRQQRPGSFIATLGLAPGDVAAIEHGNARRFLKM